MESQAFGPEVLLFHCVWQRHSKMLVPFPLLPQDRVLNPTLKGLFNLVLFAGWVRILFGSFKLVFVSCWSQKKTRLNLLNVNSVISREWDYRWLLLLSFHYKLLSIIKHNYINSNMEKISKNYFLVPSLIQLLLAFHILWGFFVCFLNISFIYF